MQADAYTEILKKKTLEAAIKNSIEMGKRSVSLIL